MQVWVNEVNKNNHMREMNIYKTQTGRKPQKCGRMFMCVVLSAQVVKFQVNEVVREDMWQNFVLKICLILCMKNTGKNCPFGI